MPAELVLDLAAVASGFIAGFEVLVGLVHLVGRTEFPVVQTLLALLVDLVGIHGASGGESPGC